MQGLYFDTSNEKAVAVPETNIPMTEELVIAMDDLGPGQVGKMG